MQPDSGNLTEQGEAALAVGFGEDSPTQKRELHKQRVASDFSASAAVYDSHAFLQQWVLQELAGISISDFGAPTAQGAARSGRGSEAMGGQAPQQKIKILDAGTGTGMLAELWPQAEIIGLDIAEGMCRVARSRIPQVMVADMESLPLADAVVEGVVSSLAVQWLANPANFLREAWRVCRMDGELRVATLASQTLQELRQAYQQAGLTPPVLDFSAGEKLAELCKAAGWQQVQQEEKMLHTTHPHLRALLHYLKCLGAGYKQGRGMRTPSHLRSLETHYPKNAEDNTITASWQVVMLRARKL